MSAMGSSLSKSNEFKPVKSLHQARAEKQLFSFLMILRRGARGQPDSSQPLSKFAAKLSALSKASASTILTTIGSFVLPQTIAITGPGSSPLQMTQMFSIHIGNVSCDDFGQLFASQTANEFGIAVFSMPPGSNEYKLTRHIGRNADWNPAIPASSVPSGTVLSPGPLGVTSEGQPVVFDSARKDIQVYSPQGQLLSSVAVNAALGPVVFVRTLSISEKDTIFAGGETEESVDYSFQQLTITGEPVAMFADPESMPSGRMLAADGSGGRFLLAGQGGVLQRWDSAKREFVDVYPNNFDDPEQSSLTHAKALGVYGGAVMVLRSFTRVNDNEIVAIDRSGKVLHRFTSNPDWEHHFYNAHDFTVTPQGRLVVADQQQGHLIVYQLPVAPPRTVCW